ncbi:ABC transporter ATP-binding protein [Robertmurraya andreesenii]|uniref:ABC-2 type transport system ATP-binding protein n=1 Tax=Anoxybacillus andreesenii TaxID=1325932 RepID=A0ABT9UYN8_9BACL|nr:ABC transporter ATP-binding protein [Robertmurraya andreesenii]MDQ0153806.1 ABC-2 type transport system ATP-binding protein [Robertmurraya andreesenii]
MGINVINLSKKIKSQYILKNISFHVQDREILGIIGNNGAGKSTLLKILATLSNFEGQINIDDKQLNTNSIQLKKEIGFHIETTPFYPYLTGYEFLSIVLKYKQIPKDTTFLDKKWPLNMNEHKHKKIKTYSQGMIQKLGILAATIGNYKIVLLDEPHNSLDPSSILELRSYIQKIRENGSIVIISSHSLDEISKLCDTVLMLNNGEIKEIISNEEGVDLELRLYN